MHLHKAKFLLFSIFLLQAHAHATHNPTGNSPTFNNNPTISPHIPITVNPTFTTNTTSTINAVGVQMRDFAITIQQKIKETFTKDNYNNAKDLLKTLLWQYRYKIAAGTVLGAYGTTTVILLNDYHYLTHPDRWGNWKSDCNFEMLCSIPHHELEQTLVRAIGEHHVNKKNPTDLSHPLVTFIETIEKEIKTCKRYINMSQTIQRLHLSKIFPVNNDRIMHANSCLERALFIKHIFLSWLTERNLLMTKKRNKMRLLWPL